MDSIPVRYLLDLKIERTPYTNFLTVNENDSIETVFIRMTGAKILSIPVLFTYLGVKKWILVDLLQITRALLPSIENLESFFSQPIGSILDLHAESPSLDLEKDPTLLDLVKLLGTGQFHRILINKDSDPIGILSQMDIIRFICKNLHLIPEGLRFTSVLNLGKTGVISVKETDEIVDALATVCKYGIYGVAVLNTEGKIVGNFSVSDLRGCSVETLKHVLKLTLNGFFTKTKTFLTKDLVYAQFDTHFEAVMQQMVQKHVHRVYITDSCQMPVSVFSTSDAVNHILVSAVSNATV